MLHTTVKDKDELGETIGEALLKPHTEYASKVLPLVEKKLVKGIAHITGGGFSSNIPRIIPKGLGAEITRNWKVPPIFTLLKNLGNVPDEDMEKTFNMGIGLVMVVDERDAEEVLKGAKESIIIGKIMKCEGVRYVDG